MDEPVREVALEGKLITLDWVEDVTVYIWVVPLLVAVSNKVVGIHTGLIHPTGLF